MGTAEKVGVLILLLLLLLMFAFFGKKLEEPTSNVETGQGGWSVPKPPPRGPGAAWDADIMYREYKPVLGALLFEAALEVAGEIGDKFDKGNQEIEHKIETQNEVDSKKVIYLRCLLYIYNIDATFTFLMNIIVLILHKVCSIYFN